MRSQYELIIVLLLRFTYIRAQIGTIPILDRDRVSGGKEKSKRVKLQTEIMDGINKHMLPV